MSIRDTGSRGEGFAFFRWRTLNLYHYVLAESRPKLMNCWPIFAEWPAEKKRRERRTDSGGSISVSEDWKDWLIAWAAVVVMTWLKTMGGEPWTPF
jgi:hypothetical protein